MVSLTWKSGGTSDMKNDALKKIVEANLTQKYFLQFRIVDFLDLIVYENCWQQTILRESTFKTRSKDNVTSFCNKSKHSQTYFVLRENSANLHRFHDLNNPRQDMSTRNFFLIAYSRVPNCCSKWLCPPITVFCLVKFTLFSGFDLL